MYINDNTLISTIEEKIPFAVVLILIYLSVSTTNYIKHGENYRMLLLDTKDMNRQIMPSLIMGCYTSVMFYYLLDKNVLSNMKKC